MKNSCYLVTQYSNLKCLRFNMVPRFIHSVNLGFMIHLCNKYIKTVDKETISAWSVHHWVIVNSNNLMSHEYDFYYYFNFY